MNDKQIDMNLSRFGPWLQEKTGTEIRSNKERTDCVVNIDHIEAGSFLALYALSSADKLLVVELMGYFPSAAAAWEALDHHQESYAPLPFEEWLEQQYITDREAQVEHLQV